MNRTSTALTSASEADREVPALLAREVSGDQRGRGTAEIVNAIREIFSYVDLTVRIRDLVDDLHDVLRKESAFRTAADPANI